MDQRYHILYTTSTENHINVTIFTSNCQIYFKELISLTFTQICTISVALLSFLMSDFPSSIILPCLRLPFIWISLYVTLIPEKDFCLLWIGLFFQHFKSVLPTSSHPYPMTSDKNSSITQITVPLEVICYFSLIAFKMFFLLLISDLLWSAWVWISLGLPCFGFFKSVCLHLYLHLWYFKAIISSNIFSTTFFLKMSLKV